MQHGKVEISRSARLEVFGKAPHQHFADPGMARLWVDGKAPEGRAALGVTEQPMVIHPRYGSDDIASRLLLRNKIGQRAAVPLRPEEIGRDRHHAPRGIDGIDGLRVGLGGKPPDEEALRLTPARPIRGQVEAVGMGRIKESLAGREPQKHMRIAHVEGDVALVVRLFAERLDDLLVVRICLGEDQLAPTAIERDGPAHGLRFSGHFDGRLGVRA